MTDSLGRDELLAGLVPDRGRGDWPRCGFAIPCRLTLQAPVKPGDPSAERTETRKHHHPGRLRRPSAAPAIHEVVRVRDTYRMVDDIARDRAIYHALKAADEVAAALQTHLIEEHGAEPERAAQQSPSTNSLKLLRQARERLGQGLRAVEADQIAESDEISLRNH
jgi:hypothetical protein